MQHPFGEVELVTAVAPEHPLAQATAPIDDSEPARHAHIVIRDCSTRISDKATIGIDSTRRWTVDDSHARHALVKSGLGWGRPPLHQIRADLHAGALVEIEPARWGGRKLAATMSYAYPKDRPPGPGDASASALQPGGYGLRACGPDRAYAERFPERP